MDGPSNLNVPIYHSNASFSKKIYLDFDGQVVTGTWWNGQNYTGSYNTGATINAPAFSLDGDFANFDSTELALIQEVWARVSEDYAPFQVDVTTEEPPLSQFTRWQRGNARHHQYQYRCDYRTAMVPSGWGRSLSR